MAVLIVLFLLGFTVVVVGMSEDEDTVVFIGALAIIICMLCVKNALELSAIDYTLAKQCKTAGYKNFEFNGDDMQFYCVGNDLPERTVLEVYEMNTEFQERIAEK